MQTKQVDTAERGDVTKFIALDVESGGIDRRTTSLLTACFIVTDSNYKTLDELNLTIKPNDGVYKVVASAMEVNGIDLIEHDKKAITYSEAGNRLRVFLSNNSSPDKDKRLVPLGKNVTFDIEFINEHLLSKGVWNNFVSYKFYDLTTAILFAKRTRALSQSAPESLSALADHLGIRFTTRAHEARSDTIMTIEIMRRLEDMARTVY